MSLDYPDTVDEQGNVISGRERWLAKRATKPPPWRFAHVSTQLDHGSTFNHGRNRAKKHKRAYQELKRARDG